MTATVQSLVYHRTGCTRPHCPVDSNGQCARDDAAHLRAFRPSRARLQPENRYAGDGLDACVPWGGSPPRAALRYLVLAHTGEGGALFGKVNCGVASFGAFLVTEGDRGRLHVHGEGRMAYEAFLAQSFSRGERGFVPSRVECPRDGGLRRPGRLLPRAGGRRSSTRRNGLPASRKSGR